MHYINSAILKTYIVLAIGTIIFFTTDCMGQSRTPFIPYEVPRVLVASQILPPELSIGDNYSVSGRLATPRDAVNYGFTNEFQIVSSFGNFEAHCEDMLRIRIQEIKAIGILREIKNAKAFDNALKKAGKSSYSGVIELILHPVDTVTGIPRGGWRFITRSGEMVKGGPEGKEDTSGDALIDFSKLKRRYAYKLGVDVYSTNKVLQKELNSVSWAGFASGAGISLIKKPLRGTEGMVIERTPFLDKIDKILLDNAPEELLLINQEKLKQMGVKEPVIKEFLSHPAYSPRHETIIVHALAEMDGARNRDQFIKQALLAEHEERSLLYQLLAEMMHSYHKNVKPIRDLIPIRKLAVGYTADQAIISMLPLDYVYWSEMTDLFVSEILLLLESEDRPVKRVNLWISGEFTPTAKKALAAKGITLKENM
jgi:hypothetical protein